MQQRQQQDIEWPFIRSGSFNATKVARECEPSMNVV